MIFEKKSNAYLAEWEKAHNLKPRVFEANELEEKLEACRTLDAQDNYWKGISPYLSSYHAVRAPLIHAYTELVHHIFSKYMPEVSGGVEFGCGPQNSFHSMLAKDLQKNWVMVDVQPSSVFIAKDNIFVPKRNIAKKKNSNGRYCVGSFSYPFIKNGSQELVAGFNSFETTMHIEHVMNEMYSILKKGGYLLAIQDVIPSEFSTLLREYTKRKASINTMSNDATPILMDTDNGLCDLRSYHIEDMKKIGESLGMNTIFSGTIESFGLYKRNGSHDIPKLDKEDLSFSEDSTKNMFYDLVSSFSAGTDPSLPAGFVHEAIGVNALILKK